jgi:hypothetical protein
VGNCEYCHKDPRPSAPGWDAPTPGDNGVNSGVNVPTQMACRECHISFENGSMIVTKFTRSNYVSYATEQYAKETVHSIDNPELAALGRINNYGICFSCHDGIRAEAVTVWHARPDKAAVKNGATSNTWVLGQRDSARCTSYRDIIDGGDMTVPANLAKFLPGRTGGGISDFNLFVEKLTAEDEEGFGRIPGYNQSAPCGDAQAYQTNYITQELDDIEPGSFKLWVASNGDKYIERWITSHPDWEYVTIPAVPGNGNTSGRVPVFASLCPNVVVDGQGVEDCPLLPTVLAPAPPTLSWPAINYSGQVCYPAGQNLLQWNASADATEYNCEVKLGSTVVASSGWTTATSFCPVDPAGYDLPDNKTYTWSVSAKNSAGTSDPSATRSWFDYWW